MMAAAAATAAAALMQARAIVINLHGKAKNHGIKRTQDQIPAYNIQTDL